MPIPSHHRSITGRLERLGEGAILNPSYRAPAPGCPLGSGNAANRLFPDRIPLTGRRCGRPPEQVTALDALHAAKSRLYPHVDQPTLRALRPNDFRSHGTKVEHVATTNERNASFQGLQSPSRAARDSHQEPRVALSFELPQTTPGLIDLCESSNPMAKHQGKAKVRIPQKSVL
jgi:hypothetical protein